MVKPLSMTKSVCSTLLVLPIFLLNPVERVTVSEHGLAIAFNSAVAQDDEEGSGRQTRRAMAISRTSIKSSRK